MNEEKKSKLTEPKALIIAAIIGAIATISVAIYSNNTWFKEEGVEVVCIGIKQRADSISNELKKVLEKYKIRIKCELNIVKEDVFFEINEKEDTLSVKPTNEAEHHLDWSDVEMAYELPSLNIIESGLLPNEIKWLESFVDFYKGCFMGQEQASRVKFRGNPRRILKTLSNSTQEIVKK